MYVTEIASVEEAVTARGVECLVCGEPQVEAVLDLGRTGLANNLPLASELASERTYPLRLARCPACTHIQLADRVPPGAMFQHYLYMSSASSTLTNHLASLAREVVERTTAPPDALSIDIGSNDGTLASCFRKSGLRAFGVDPAQNLAPVAASKGVEVKVSFFGLDFAKQFVREVGRAHIITATNSFPHIPEINDFLLGVKHALHPDGIFAVEAHYLLDLVEQCAFDTVYHEHVHYWRLGTMLEPFARVGLEIVDCERLPIHHGQLRIWVRHSGKERVSPRVRETLDHELRAGLGERETFTRFAGRAGEIRREFHRCLRQLRDAGQTVAGYGAPAKASTLAAWLRLSSADIPWIADRNQLKHGRFTPSTHIPIVDVERIQAEKPDVLILFAWNFADEIIAQLASYRAGGGRFLIPVPEVRIV